MAMQTTFHESDDGIVVQRKEYVADIVDDAKARHNEGLHGLHGMKHAARVPVVVIEHYCNVNRITLREFVMNQEHKRRLLNDPAFADLRIWPGKV